MARIRHIAIATKDPDATAAFYREVFGLRLVRESKGKGYSGYILSDGSINFAILRFDTDQAAGAEFGTAFAGLHHIGFHVDDLAAAASKITAHEGRARRDIDAGIGIPNADFKYTGPDGVMFDVSQRGWAWDGLDD